MIDWNKFEAGQDLTAITSRIDEVEKDQKEGITIWIENLRDCVD